MRSEELDVDDLRLVVDRNHQAIPVASDVEDHAIVTDDARRLVSRPYVLGRGPRSRIRFLVPGAQRLLCIAILRPCLDGCLASNDPHLSTARSHAPKMGARLCSRCWDRPAQ